MNRNLYIRIGLFLLALLPLSMSAQCVTRNVTNCKNYDPNQAIGAAMQGFFTDGSTGSFQWLPGATIQDCADGTALLTGKLKHFGNADRVFNVSIQFVRRSCNLAPGAYQETDNLPAGTPTTGWYYYEWGTATMVGEGHLTGAVLNLVQHMMPAQAGVNAHNQSPDVGKLGVTGWFEWQIVSQPSNGWLTIAPYAGGVTDVCFVMDGTPPNYCNGDPCATFPTPSVTTTNATNGGANGCINITNLPAGASSSINGGASTAGKVQYCGLAAGSYTITISKDGCVKTATVIVGNTNTDPCITNPVPNPTTTVSNATNGMANGCINITNLPSGASSSINGGAATVGKTQYCGLAAGTYTITVNLNGCIKSVTVTVGNTNTDPCITNPVPTPTTTVSNATNGGANGCINITNLPAGASSSINGGAATAGKVQYCGLAAGTYTITVSLNGCVKTVTVTVGNTNTDPCIANPVPTPTYTVTNTTNGQANGCINITNLPTGASSSINGGTATVGKTQYCSLAAGTYTITVNKNGCIKSVTVTVGGSVDVCSGVVQVRPVYNTKLNCNTGASYVAYMDGAYYTAGTDLTFTEYTNGTAILKGNVHRNGVATYVNVTYSGRTCSAAGSPKLGDGNGVCSPTAGYNTTNWYYYTSMSGKFGTMTLTQRGPAFQVGNFANLQQNVMGASGWWYGNGSSIGDFNFNLGNCTSCCSGQPAITCNNPPVNCNSVSGNTITKSCVNNIPVLTGAALANYEYMWLKSTTSCPNQTSQAIAGATGQNYSLPSRVTVKTYFIRCARPVGCTTWGTINESNCITVNANECAPAPVCNTNFSTSKCYKIVNVATGKILDVANFSYSDNAKVQQYTYGGGNNQKWQIASLGSGYFKVAARHSGKVLACHETATGSQVYQYTYYTGGAKDWKIECQSNGFYKITHRLSGKVLDVSGSSTANSAKIQIWDWHGGNNQLWKIEEVSCTSGVYAATSEVMSMDAHAEVNRARVEWVNNTGYKNDFFTVEKMNTAGDFEKLEIVNTQYTEVPEHYVSFDNNPTEGDNFYRVGVTFNDGTTKYSETKKVTFSSLSTIRVFPNPADDYIEVDLKQYKGSAASIYLYNSFGQQVQFVNIDKVGDGTTRLDIAAQGAGNYMIRVASKDKRDVTKQVIISK